MSLIKLCAYTRCRNGLFCNSTAYAHTSAHLTWVALRVHWDVCVSVGWRSWGCGSLTDLLTVWSILDTLLSSGVWTCMSLAGDGAELNIDYFRCCWLSFGTDGALFVCCINIWGVDNLINNTLLHICFKAAMRIEPTLSCFDRVSQQLIFHCAPICFGVSSFVWLLVLFEAFKIVTKVSAGSFELLMTISTEV
jgi:hypothetical protein